MAKPIRLSAHAQGRATRRGFTLAEVEDTIRSSPWKAADLGRLECQKEFPVGQSWNGKFYAFKKVRPVFVEKAREIVVVTVYTYFF
jgi:hypothetical protein